ncbi:hypothetical protein BDA99DRAFT_574398 [Phascolomyces articulosus]|uniref:Uncharacterized protein n=1 Tax=Phascolomyces articulosus TaxID=60185 RepID=A0AAD5JTI9_9FUNG|nr:hypothetical protein BDA99DRAFT_574398 [Phascolomyces articulosus]
MSEQNNLNLSVEKYQLLVRKAGSLPEEEQHDLVSYAGMIIGSLYTKIQQQAPAVAPTTNQQQQTVTEPTEGQEEEVVQDDGDEDEEETHLENEEERMKHALKLVDDAKKKSNETTLTIANQCGLSIIEVEGLFGGKSVKLYSSPKTRNTWTQFASEEQKFENEHPEGATEREKTKWVNKGLSSAYSLIKNDIDQKKFNELQARANDYNHANGLCGAVNSMSIDQKMMMAQEIVEVLRNNLQKLRDLTGLESFTLFGSYEFHRTKWKLRRLGTDMGLSFIDQMNKESNASSNFYALQEKFEIFCKPSLFSSSSKRSRSNVEINC